MGKEIDEAHILIQLLGEGGDAAHGGEGRALLHGNGGGAGDVSEGEILDIPAPGIGRFGEQADFAHEEEAVGGEKHLYILPCERHDDRREFPDEGGVEAGFRLVPEQHASGFERAVGHQLRHHADLAQALRQQVCLDISLVVLGNVEPAVFQDHPAAERILQRGEDGLHKLRVGPAQCCVSEQDGQVAPRFLVGGLAFLVPRQEAGEDGKQLAGRDENTGVLPPVHGSGVQHHIGGRLGGEGIAEGDVVGLHIDLCAAVAALALCETAEGIRHEDALEALRDGGFEVGLGGKLRGLPGVLERLQIGVQ